MSSRTRFAYRSVLLALCSLLLGAAPPGSAAPAANSPSADSVFASAKGVWRTRSGPPFVCYSLLERYTWRNRTHDNWWHAAYRERDRRLSLERIVIPEEEAARMRGTSIGINFRLHHAAAHADSLETNADADAFSILDPLVDPDASFGLARREAQVDLGGRRYGVMPSLAASSPTPAAVLPLGPSATPSALGAAADRPLRELARVDAVARDYTIALVGVERVRNVDAYHLALVPLREPRTYRLRDLWIATTNYETLQLRVDGLFNGRPYDDARWTVTFVDFGGLAYVQQIRADDTLRFGVDRYVSGLEYDFVDYSFPPDVSPLEFERLL